MKRLTSLPSMAALGAAVLAFQVGTAAAHVFTVQNCTGQLASFNAYNEGDSVAFDAVVSKAMENGESKSLHCESSNRCRVQAISGSSPVYRVTDEITFYSHTEYTRSLDRDCSQKP